MSIIFWWEVAPFTSPDKPESPYEHKEIFTCINLLFSNYLLTTYLTYRLTYDSCNSRGSINCESRLYRPVWDIKIELGSCRFRTWRAPEAPFTAIQTNRRNWYSLTTIRRYSGRRQHHKSWSHWLSGTWWYDAKCLRACCIHVLATFETHDTMKYSLIQAFQWAISTISCQVSLNDTAELIGLLHRNEYCDFPDYELENQISYHEECLLLCFQEHQIWMINLEEHSWTCDNCMLYIWCCCGHWEWSGVELATVT